MIEKVLCPYCGSEMRERYSRYSCFGECSIEFDAFYRCGKCGAQGPLVRLHGLNETREKAKAAALRRYTPPLRPLTLEEVKSLCETGSHCIYTEHFHANPDITNPVTPNVGNKSGLGYRITHCNGYRYKFAWSDYGKTWRCWERKPTKEEMEAAAW